MSFEKTIQNIEEMAHQLRQDYLYMLLQNRPSWIQGIDQVNRCYQYHFPAGNYYIFILAASSKISNELIPVDRYSSAGNYIRSSLISAGDECEVLYYKQKLYGIVGSGKTKAEMDAVIHRLFDALKELPHMYTITWTMGLGKFVPEIDQLSESCFSAKHAIQYSIVDGTGKIHDGNSRNLIYEGAQTLLTSGDQIKLEQALKAPDIEEVIHFTEDLYLTEKAGQIKAYPVYAFMIANQLLEIAMQILRTIMPVDRKTYEIIQNYQSGIEDQLALEDIIALSEKALCDIYRRYEEYRSNGNSRPIWLVITYIQEHYTEKLTLEDIASAANRNPQYISTLFKKECGMPIMNYVSSYRIEKAKELIRSRNLTVGEVSRLVGYQDTQYFSRVFKQITGMSPRAFREKEHSSQVT